MPNLRTKFLTVPLIRVGHDVDRQRRILIVRSRQYYPHSAGNGLAASVDQEGMNGPLVVNVRFLPLYLPIRVFIGILDAVDLVAQPIDLIEKVGRVRPHDLEMLSVARQEILPTSFPRHEHLTRNSPARR
jgi:hypothetical protein